MIGLIDNWIEITNERYKGQRVCCDVLAERFEGYYSREFLSQAYYVVVDKIPKPDFPALSAVGLRDFMGMEANGITYKNTYYMLRSVQAVERIHFHELVHVAQWQSLGSSAFIARYMNEILTCGYAQAPLEQMAYFLDAAYSDGDSVFDVLEYVSDHI